MLSFLADENLRHAIPRALRRENPDIEVIRAQDTPLYGRDDPTVLAWAAQARRIVLTHDAKTMPRYAYERVKEGKPMAGVIVVRDFAQVRQATEDILLMNACLNPTDCVDQVRFLPL